MSLPTLVAPTYDIKLFSQPRPIEFRPYLVKEEKLLLTAQQGNDATEIERAVKQIVRNCTFDKIDVDALPSFDTEFLFLQLRAKSVDNIIRTKFRCQNQVADKPVIATSDIVLAPPTKPCDTLVEVVINIDDIKLTVPEGHDPKIWLSDNVGITMKYPTAAVTELGLTQAIAACLENVYNKTGDEVLDIKDQTPEEVMAFVESMTMVQVEKIRHFFDTMPVLKHTFTFKCTKCGWTEDVTLKGLMDFFD